MKKVFSVIIFLLVISVKLFAQSDFNLKFNFATLTSNDTLINTELFDFNNDGVEEIVFSSKNDTNWIIQIFDISGVLLQSYGDTLSYNKNLKFAKLFRYDGNNYLALLSNMLSEEVNLMVKFSLQIIDLTNLEMIDKAEGYTWDFVSFPYYYESLLLKDINFFNSNDTVNISIGYEALDEWSDIGETYGKAYYQNTLIFKFNGTFKYFNDPFYKVTQLVNCSKLMPVSMLGIGSTKGSSSGTWGSNSYSRSYISKINHYVSPTTIEQLAEFETYGLKLLSSDDSTNYQSGVVSYTTNKTSWNTHTKTLYATSIFSGDTLWSKEEEMFRYHDITASSNLTLSSGNYLCYFSDYTMQVINRDNGEMVHYELSSISPIEILTTPPNDKLYFITKSGTRTINVYELANIDFIISDVLDENKDEMPTEYSLSQNYPNPFNPTTIIKYTIPLNVKRETANVKLVVYDVLGKEVATLVDKEQQAGSYEVEFDASILTSGVYFYRIITDKFFETKKMILIR